MTAIGTVQWSCKWGGTWKKSLESMACAEPSASAWTAAGFGKEKSMEPSPAAASLTTTFRKIWFVSVEKLSVNERVLKDDHDVRNCLRNPKDYMENPSRYSCICQKQPTKVTSGLSSHWWDRQLCLPES